MYKRATRKGDVNNHIAKHHRLTNHTIITNYFQRLTLESRLTNLEQTPLNSCQPIPAPNKQLIYDINITNEQNDLTLPTDRDDQSRPTFATWVLQPITWRQNWPINLYKPDVEDSTNKNYSFDPDNDFPSGSRKVSQHERQQFLGLL